MLNNLVDTIFFDEVIRLGSASPYALHTHLARTHSALYTGVLLFCCHKCHAMGKMDGNHWRKIVRNESRAEWKNDEKQLDRNVFVKPCF